MAIVHRSRGAGLVYGLGRFGPQSLGHLDDITYGTGLGADPLPPTALAVAAQAILDSLPAGSGSNPIGTAAYPFPHDPPSEIVVDRQYGGTRNVDWYWAHPVPDPSGLIQWTGPDSAEIRDGLNNAQVLAANVLLNHGDTSFSADFHPATTNQTGLDPTSGSSSGSQSNYIVSAPVGMPAGWTYSGPNTVAPEALVGPHGETYTATPAATPTTQKPVASMTVDPTLWGANAGSGLPAPRMLQSVRMSDGSVVTEDVTQSTGGGGFGGGGESLAAGVPGGWVGVVAVAALALALTRNTHRRI